MGMWECGNVGGCGECGDGFKSGHSLLLQVQVRCRG